MTTFDKQSSSRATVSCSYDTKTLWKRARASRPVTAATTENSDPGRKLTKEVRITVELKQSVLVIQPLVVWSFTNILMLENDEQSRVQKRRWIGNSAVQCTEHQQWSVSTGMGRYDSLWALGRPEPVKIGMGRYDWLWALGRPKPARPWQPAAIGIMDISWRLFPCKFREIAGLWKADHDFWSGRQGTWSLCTIWTGAQEMQTGTSITVRLRFSRSGASAT